MPNEPAPLHFTAPDGAAHTVRDVVYGRAPASPGTWVELPLGDVRATGRVFAPVDRGRVTRCPRGNPLYRRYDLTVPEADRGADVDTLRAQWREAGRSWWDPRPLAEIMAEIDRGAGDWQSALGLR